MNADPREVMAACSNHGRWGEHDQLGLLNLVDDDARRRAAALVRTGEVVVLGRTLPTDGSTVAHHPVVHRMLHAPGPHTALDEVTVTPHDPQITHIDALGHTWWDGAGWNGVRRDDAVGPTGLGALGVERMSRGVFNRGVLLDVARVRGVPYLPADGLVGADDLSAAEAATGTRLRPGDSVVVHVGRAERVAAEQVSDHPVPRAGLGLDAMPWLHERDVAVFLGDCTERLPPRESAVPFPLHQIGAVAMGLCLIDGALTSELVATVDRLGTSEFLFCCTVPRLDGGTGFPVNPLAVF